MNGVYVIVKQDGRPDVFLLPQGASGPRVSEVGLRNLATKRDAVVVVLTVGIDGKITLSEEA